MSRQLQAKGQQIAESQKISNVVAQVETALASSFLPREPLQVVNVQTSGQSSDLMTKVKNFFTTPITGGSKIQYWHVAVGLVVGFVLYVEMVADRKTQRKLKFW